MKILLKLLKSNHFLYIFSILFLPLVGFIYYQRVGGFSLGDEWNNFMAAFFMQKERNLFSQIFFNHQVFIVYISYLIQILLHPGNLYKLVLFHRMFILLFALIFDVLIIYRFRLKGLAFVFTYELTKFYVFGHLFLAEGFIVYPLVYMFALAFEKINKKSLGFIEIILSGIFAWFIIFMREPFIPVALLLYLIIILKKKIDFQTYASLIIFVTLSVLTLLPIAKSLPDYFDQVIMFNIKVMLPTQAGNFAGDGILHIIFYPIFILLEGKWNHFRLVLINLDLIFMVLMFSFIKLKKYKIVGFIVLILTLCAIRFVPPGTMYFEAFHMAPWYGLFIMSTSLLVREFLQLKNINYVITCLILAISVVLFINTTSFKSFIWEKVNKEELFTINYANYFINGEVIRLLANPKDTLFTDLWDYLIYWQANLDSSYKYAVYIFSMRGTLKYDLAKEEMFKSNPPDFYYTYCSKGVYHSDLMPKFALNEYLQLYLRDKPACIYIKKTKLPLIPQTKWNEVQKFGFYPPK